MFPLHAVCRVLASCPARDSGEVSMPDGGGGEAVRPFLKLSGVRSTYPGVVALAGFDMTVAPAR